jgi:ECF transporter S component (folate family)
MAVLEGKPVLNFFKRIAGEFAESARELKKLRSLIACSLMLALGIVLNLFATVPVSDTLKVSTSFVALAAIGLLFGPVPAMVSGGLLDVVSFVVKPLGAYFPGFTISGILSGLIYGLFLYRRSVKSLFIAAPLSKLLVNVFINLVLNTYWLTFLSGKGFLVMLPVRVLKNIVAWPIESAVLILVAVFLTKNRKRLLR